MITHPGGPEVLEVQDVPDPQPGPGEVVVDVAATAVNRADLMQRQGHYPPPPGASDVLGLECSGRIAALGDGVTGWSLGDEVCALLAGGGYATRVAVPAGQLLPVPAGLTLEQAAALPEVACTVWSMVFQAGRLRPGETLLVHGGCSGIGTMATQLAVALGSRVLVTVGTERKAEFCRQLGAAEVINYREEDFVERAGQATGGRGVDVVLDNMGAAYLARNLQALAPDGRLIVLGMQGGRVGELDLGVLLAKRGTVHAAGLRARSLEDKARIVAATRDNVWPLVAQAKVRPVIDRVFALDEVADAHRLVEASEHIGKVLLRA